MTSPFLRAPFKATLLGLSATALFAFPAGADPVPLGNLNTGGTDLFHAIVPSVIQITNGGAGSGYIIDKGGYAITNTHVTHPNQVFEVALYDPDTNVGTKRYKGSLIGEDAALDMALIKIEAPDDLIVPIALADTSKVRVGDTVATCGSPGGGAGEVNIADPREGWLDYFNFNMGTLTEIIPFSDSLLYFTEQARGAEFYAPDYATAVQYLFHVDAAINRGNSGGPCVNDHGQVIGTNTWGYGSNPGITENVGYAVPASLLARSAREIIQYGRARRPWLGIALHDPNPPQNFYRDAEEGLTDNFMTWIDPTPEELKIYVVNPYSPAYGKLKEGDIITGLDHREFTSIFELYAYILNKQVGDKVTLFVERNGMGLPPIVIELAEKKNRYNATRVDSITNTNFGNYNVSAQNPRSGGVMQITY